ncbi:MAG: LysR family transcriptional regulator [Cyanobacteriota bacterium]|nr:LysR family transcriptional regulator [Cyanobacteriota bacterium]
MKHATLHQLKVFEATARHRSFTRAAEEMFLTQPTVSMQVKQLAKAVGMPLFEQLGKKLYLTEAGQELYSTCQAIFDQLDQLEMKVADLKGLKQGRLRLAVVTTAKYFIPRLLGPFCHRYPGIDITLQVTNRQQLLERLVNNLDDLYILGLPPADLDIVAQPFLENPLLVLAAPDHPLAHTCNISAAQLAQEPFLMREPGSGTRTAVQRWFAQHGVTPQVRMELGSSEAIKQAVVGGLGISVLSKHVLALGDGLGHLSVLDVQGFPLPGDWYLVYLAGKHLSVVARTFADYLLNEGKTIAMQTALPVESARA